MTRSPGAALLRAEITAFDNRWTRGSAPARRFRSLLVVVAVLVVLLLFGASYRAFNHLLHNLTLTPELGAPLVLRLLEMGHLLFLVMLFISALSVTLSVLYLDPEIGFLMTTPLSRGAFRAARILTAVIRSSWFVFLAATPILLGHACAAFEPAFILPRFLLSLAILTLYVLVAASPGVATAVLIARFVPARRAKAVMVILAVIGLSLLVLGMRAMAPERFLRPRIDPNLGITLAAVAEPASPWLPSGWAAEAVANADPAAGGKLAAAALLALGLCGAIVARHHEAGLNRVNRERSTTLPPGSRAAARLARLLPARLRLVAVKDFKLFWRDPSQWSQLIILLALVVLYVFNFRQFKGEIATVFLKDIVSFANLAMAGFVLTAVANRFVFSALSLEGRAIWILRSSPYPLARVFLTKALTAFLPLLLLTETITWLSNRALDVSPGFLWASALSVLLMTAALTSLGVGLGALAPRFDLKDPAQIGMTPAGLVFMGAGLVYVGLTVLSLAAVIMLAWRSRFLGDLPSAPLVIVLVFFSIALHSAMILVPWRLGLERIRRLELRA